MKPIETIRDQQSSYAGAAGDEHNNSFNRGYIAALVRDIELANDAYVNAYGNSVWFTVHNRDDLMKLMTLASLWTKSTDASGIRYTATVDGIKVCIIAEDAALPDTCKLVEEEVTIPAQPERKEKRLVVKCDQPTTADSPAT